LNETEEEQTWVQETLCDEKVEATARATHRGSCYGKENPQKFRLFTREDTGLPQTASDGPQKVDAPIHCSQP